MDNAAGMLGSAALWLALIAVVGVIAVAARYRRSRKPVATAEPEATVMPAEASFLDSSHVGGPIAGTEQFERFNPDTSKRKGRPGP